MIEFLGDLFFEGYVCLWNHLMRHFLTQVFYRDGGDIAQMSCWNYRNLILAQELAVEVLHVFVKEFFLTLVCDVKPLQMRADL